MSGNRRNERQQTVETRAGVIADAVPDVAKGGGQRVYVGVAIKGVGISRSRSAPHGTVG
jgi:hypothetical protein